SNIRSAARLPPVAALSAPPEPKGSPKPGAGRCSLASAALHRSARAARDQNPAYARIGPRRRRARNGCLRQPSVASLLIEVAGKIAHQPPICFFIDLD